jgi:hypothetical protein
MAKITRRSAVGLLGAGGLAGALLANGTLSTEIPVQSSAAGTSPEVLQAGSRFGRWAITRVHEVARGALQVDVRDQDGHEFALEIMARDGMASRPPAEVGALAVYVRNGGDGWSATVEEQGLAAMGLARFLELNGQTGAIEGLLSHSDRVVAHADVLHASFIPAAG